MKNNTRKTVTLYEVAALAGIDIATASRALRGKGYVSQKTRDAALKAAQELGYQPDLHAQNLAQGRLHNVISLLPVNDLGVLTNQAVFIEHRLDELDYEVQVHHVPHWVNRFEDKQIALVNKVRRQRPGAIISGSPLVPNALEELRFFIQEGGIVIAYEEIDLECDQVLLDHPHRTYIAAKHLLELGHRDLGLCLHSTVEYGSKNIAGFKRAMEEFGVPIHNEWIFGGGNYEEGGARLAEAFLSWSKKPTAMCIINDVSASVFVTALARSGVRVPDDVSVVGFDDAPIAEHSLVPLTSVNYPIETISGHVVEFTQGRLKGYDGPPRKVMVQSEIVTRSSTAPLGVNKSFSPDASVDRFLLKDAKAPILKNEKPKTTV